LVIFAEHFGHRDFLVTSDSTREQWNEARNVCQHVLGYGLQFKLAGELPPDEKPLYLCLSHNLNPQTARCLG
jgi:hypothetical protein